jgi:segregation and condensation protein B
MLGSWFRRVKSAVGALLRGLGFRKPPAPEPVRAGEALPRPDPDETAAPETATPVPPSEAPEPGPAPTAVLAQEVVPAKEASPAQAIDGTPSDARPAEAEHAVDAEAEPQLDRAPASEPDADATDEPDARIVCGLDPARQRDLDAAYETASVRADSPEPVERVVAVETIDAVGPADPVELIEVASTFRRHEASPPMALSLLVAEVSVGAIEVSRADQADEADEVSLRPDSAPGEVSMSPAAREPLAPGFEVESLMSDPHEPNAEPEPAMPVTTPDDRATAPDRHVPQLEAVAAEPDHGAEPAAEAPPSQQPGYSSPNESDRASEADPAIESSASAPTPAPGAPDPDSPDGPGEPPASDEIKAVVEALIFASPEPLTPKALFKVLDSEPKEDVARAIESLKRDYEGRGGLQLIEVAGGFQIVTRQELNEWVSRLFHERRTSRLSVQALETLAVIAYKQPVTAAEIAEIRGVNTAGVLSTLVERKLIKSAGRKPVVGRPFLYATTREFLIRFGLNDLSDLPKVEEMAEALGFDLPAALETGPSEQFLPLGEPEAPPADASERADPSAVPTAAADGTEADESAPDEPDPHPETVN